MEITVIGDNNQVVNGDYYELVLSPESIILLLQLLGLCGFFEVN